MSGFSLGIPVSSTNKTDRYDITEIVFKVALTTAPPPFPPMQWVHLLQLKPVLVFVYGFKLVSKASYGSIKPV